MPAIPCPHCGREVQYSDGGGLSDDFPFCSERCRLIDLGKWFDERFSIDEPLLPPAHIENEGEKGGFHGGA